jgi:transcriptional regulator with XRE-family HTH domain
LSLGQAITISRVARGLKRGDLSSLGYTESMLGKIERGERRPAKDMAPRLAEKLDHPALYAELSRELTGGVGPAWLNGPNVDLHRASVREKCLEELREAMDAIDGCTSSKPPGTESEPDRRARYQHLIQCFDAWVALWAYMGVQCLEYGFSILKLSRDHFAKLKQRRYVEA